MDIFLHGEIGDDSWQGAHEWGIVGQRFVREQLEKAKEEEEINLHIHSVGGSVFEGWAMYHLFQSSGKKINTIVNGLAASMGTVFPFLGENRTITKGSQQMIHNPWSLAMGDADDMEKLAKELREIENEMIDFYHANTGYDKDLLKAEMKEETFFGADVSKAKNFSTEVVDYNEDQAVKAQAKIDLAKKYYSENKKEENGTASDFLALMKQINKKDMNKLDEILMRVGIKKEEEVKEEAPQFDAQAKIAEQEEVIKSQVEKLEAIEAKLEQSIDVMALVLDKAEKAEKEAEELKADYAKKIETVEAFAKANGTEVELPKEEFKKPENVKENPVLNVLGTKSNK